MSHDHNTHENHHQHADEKNIKVAFLLNLFFTIIEIVGGIFTNSIAILSDAIHDLGDSMSLGLAWYFQKKAKKGSNALYSYGYKRFSLLGAIINSIVLVAGCVMILSLAIPRIFNPQPSNAEGMFYLAIIGILVNGAVVFRLKKGHSINERVVSLHLIEDVLGWAAIIIGSVVMHFYNLPVLDPIMSIVIVCFVLFNVYKNIGQSFRIILQGTPDEIDIKEIEVLLKKFDEIEDVHDLHVWSVDGNYNILTVHIVINKSLSMDKMAKLKVMIRAELQSKGVQHVTIEFETGEEKCVFENCC